MSDLADFFSEMDRSNEFSKWMDEIQRTSERIDELIYPQSVLEAIYPARIIQEKGRNSFNQLI